MNRLVFIITLIVAGLMHHVAHADADPPVECFSSPEAVYEAHPGSRAVYTTHAAWWTESPKCWFVGKPIAKPMTKPRAVATVAPALPRTMAQALPAQLRHVLPAANEWNATVKETTVKETYEEVTASLRALMFGPDQSPTNFETRFSAIGNTTTWR
jgi:hypothetical protein